MSLRDALNRANPVDLLDIFRSIKLGDLVRAWRTQLYKQVPTTLSAKMIANADAIFLPNDAKASKVVRAYARSGTGTPGALIVDAPPMTTATAAGHVNVSESGDITFATADAWTAVDVDYEPVHQDIFTQQFPVVSDEIVLPTKWTTPGVVALLSAHVDAGGVTGDFAVVAPSDSKPGTTKQVNLKLAKGSVLFKAADAVTLATITVGLVPATDLNALLEASESPLI